MSTSPPLSSRIPVDSSSESLLHLLTRLSESTSTLQSRAPTYRDTLVITPALSAISKSLLYLHTLLLLPPIYPGSPRNHVRMPSLGQEPRPTTMASFATNSSSGMSNALNTEPKGELPPHLELHRELIVEMLMELGKLLFTAGPRMNTLDGPTLAVKLEKIDVGLKAICEAMTGGAGDWVGDWEMEQILGRAMGKKIDDRMGKARPVRKWTLGKIGEALTIKTEIPVKRKKETQSEIGPLTPWLLENGGGERYPGAGMRVQPQDGQNPASYRDSTQAQYGDDTWSAVVERENRREMDKQLKNAAELETYRTSVSAPSLKEWQQNLSYTENNFRFPIPPAETLISSPAIFAPVLPASDHRLSLDQPPTSHPALLDIPRLKPRSNSFHSHGVSSTRLASPPPEYSEYSSESASSATTTFLRISPGRCVPPPRPPRSLGPPQATYTLTSRANGPLSDTWLPADLSTVPSTSAENTSLRHTASPLHEPPLDETPYNSATRDPNLVIPPHEPHTRHTLRNSNPSSWKSRFSALILPSPSSSTPTIAGPATSTSSQPTFSEIRISLESYSDPSNFSRAKKPKRELWTGSIPIPLATGLNTWITEELRQYTQHPDGTIYPLRVPTVVAKRIHPIIPHARITAWAAALATPDVDFVRIRGLFWALPEDERVVVIYLLSLLRFLAVSCGRPAHIVAGLFAPCFLGDAGKPRSSNSGGSCAPTKGINRGDIRRKTMSEWGTEDVASGFEKLILTAPGLLVRSNNSWGGGEKRELKIKNEMGKWKEGRTLMGVDGSEVVKVGRVRHVLGAGAEDGGSSAWDWRGEIGGRWQGMG